jgi:hypothetical protein
LLGRMGIALLGRSQDAGHIIHRRYPEAARILAKVLSLDRPHGKALRSV